MGFAMCWVRLVSLDSEGKEHEDAAILMRWRELDVHVLPTVLDGYLADCDSRAACTGDVFMFRTALIAGATAMLSAAPVLAHNHSAHAPAATTTAQMTHADVLDLQGKKIGMVMLKDTPNGVLVSADVAGLPAGQHGFHFHEKGACDPAQKFTTAGGHFTGGKAQHGLLLAGGNHAGDMPNAYVSADGTLKSELLNTGVTLASGPHSLFDADGSALVIHAKADDYTSQPAGDAGDRIACAVVAAPQK